MNRLRNMLTGWAAIALTLVALTSPAYAQTGVNPGGLSGVVPVANGGTGDTSLTAHCVLIGAGTSAAHLVCPGTSGNVLTDNGSGSDPSFQPQTGGSGLSAIAAQSVLANFTASSALPVANTVPSCTGGSSALTYVNSSGFGCLSSILISGTNISVGTISSGAITSSGQILAGAANNIAWAGRGALASPVAGVIHIGGADSSSPAAQTFAAEGAVTTSNLAGASVTIGGGASTGTAVGGPVFLAATPAGGVSNATQNTLQNVVKVDGNQHVAFLSAAIPTVGAGTVTANSTDAAGSLTTGTSVTSVVLTFKIAYAAAPFCVVADNTNLARLTAYSVSTTALTLTMTSNTGDVVSWVCHGA